MKITHRILQKAARLMGYHIIETPKYLADNKYKAEIAHWKQSFTDYQKWYNGDLDILWGEKPPKEADKIKDYSKEINAILTWQKIHQQTKYLEDLQLKDDAFEGLTILDVGSGPHPSALAYKNCKLYCLDPLLPEYLKVGFPIHYYEDRLKFVYGFSEEMPFDDDFFDAVISVNAIDHVDDFEQTAKEIQRVLKPGGKLRMHIHYHKKTATEPIELNDEIVDNAFNWCKNFKKINESARKRGFELSGDEKYALWSNF